MGISKKFNSRRAKPDLRGVQTLKGPKLTKRLSSDQRTRLFGDHDGPTHAYDNIKLNSKGYPQHCLGSTTSVITIPAASVDYPLDADEDEGED